LSPVEQKKLRRKLQVRKISCLVCVLVSLLAGCGREQVSSPAFPMVIATFPTNGATEVITNTIVTAEFSSVMNPVTISTKTFTLTGPGATPVAGAVTYVGTTATFTPASSLSANTAYSATITTGAQDPGGNTLAANFVWTFTTGAPTVISTVPANGSAAVPVNTLVSATFSEAMNPATINAATFTLTGPGVTPVTGAISYAGSTATFTPLAVLATSTSYTATITTAAKDPTGASLETNFVWTFTTAPPPTVVSTVPANGTAAVPVNTLLSATFSKPMNPATITPSTFTLTGPGATPVAGIVTYAGTTATFTPTAALASNTLFTATITTGAKDPMGAPLAANYVWTFTTAPPPTVISTIPSNGAVGVTESATVKATFSVPMDPITINPTTFKVTGPGATAISGSVTYAASTATFTPAASLAGSSLYTATITTGAKDSTGDPLAANFVFTFTTAPPPTVTSVVPANGATGVPLNQQISATFSTPMAASTITAPGTFTIAAATGGAVVSGTVTYDAATSTVTFSPTAALSASTQYAATITTAAQNVQGSAMAANFVWNFTTGAPTVISTLPASGAGAVPINALVSATFSEAMNPATINAATFTVTGPGATPVAGTVTYAGSTATFAPTAMLASGTLFTATITTGARDPSGAALAANFVWTFTTAAPPTVITTVPASGATGVPVNTLVSATFSEPMNPATINAAAFTVTGPGITPVPGTVTYSGNTATFTPTAVLANSTLFTATITTGAKDPTGAALAVNFVWTFTTAPPPSVVSTVPANGAVAIAVNTAISETFSEVMNAATINAGTFTVTGPGATPVVGTVSYAGTTATFTPTAVLLSSTLYTATITTGAKDPAGAPLAANVVRTFTTASAPTVISTVPVNGATTVAVNTTISATFSEVMDATTINAATFTVSGPGATPVAGIVTYAGTTATFTPATALLSSTLYTATITTGAKDTAGASLAANFVWTLTTAVPPTVVSTVPASGTTGVSVNALVSDTFSEAMNAATINGATFTLTGPGATPVAGTVTYSGTTATFTPTAILANSTLFTATITTGAKDPTGAPLAANFVWTFTTAAPPTVLSTVPLNGATAVAVNTPVSATFSEAMNAATINGATFALTGPGTTPVAGTVTYAGTTATFTPTLILANSTLFTATITTGAKDPAGVPLAANFVWTFTTAAPPTVLSTVPLNGATAVAVNTPVSATFSEAMNAATINGATFTLTGPGATPVAGTVTYAGTTATFTPTLILANSTLFTATITTGAKDPTGAPLAANFVWTFTTAAPPTVVSTVPVNGATAVAVNSPISATFSEVMNAATINGATFTLTGPGATPVAGTVTYAGTTATFTPTTLLANSTLFTATITTGAKDPAGVPLAANSVWIFTTAAPPTVVSTVPVNGATAVAVNTLISATFSEAMNAATINGATFTLTGPGATPVAGTVTYVGTTATFTPTVILANSTLFTATITTGAKDPTGAPLAANFVWTFTTAAPPTVVSTVPVNGATAVAVNTPISATFSEVMNAATINGATFTLTGPGATPVAGTVTYAGTTATFTPTLILANSTVFTATITTGAKDPAGIPLAANFVSSFTTAAPPTVVSTVPVNGATNVAVNATISATFSVPMDATTINATTFTLMGPGVTAVTGSVSYTGNTATFTPSSILASSTLFTATITTGAKDPTGAPLTANFVWTFTTAPPPAVSATIPARGATSVPLNQRITATFNTLMNAPTITATGTLTLAVAGGGAAVPATVTYDAASNTAILAPTAALAANTQFTATVTTAAQSVQGSTLLANYAWSFTTGLVANAGAPRVILTNPADSALNVPINQKVAATFSQAMDPATISAAGTFTLAETIGGAVVPGLVTYDPASNTAIFTPSVVLSANTQFTATITTGAVDLTGVALGTNFAWNFTTGVTANVVAPTITGTNPASAALNVFLNKTINATFSKAMDPTTITNGTFTLAVAGVGGATVDGTVVYDPTSQIATFTPTANLTANTQYTATISNLVQDLFGNALVAGAAPNPWTFTTGSSIGPMVPDLGAISTFGAFGGGAGITNTGTSTVINGDLGTTGASTLITGFRDAGTGCNYTITGANSGFVNGKIYTNVPPPTGTCPSEGTALTFVIATDAAGDALTAYNNLAGQPAGPDPGAGQLGGLTITPGTYTSAGGSFTITGSDLTLDGQGDANAIWLFQMATTLTVGAPGFPRSVILINGAQAKNVFWQVGSAATINGAGGGTMVGTIIAPAGITFSTAGNAAITSLDGRAIGLNASVTMVNTVINVPAPQ
jgi:Ice-binding-like/Bacterial Ig-like domain